MAAIVVVAAAALAGHVLGPSWAIRNRWERLVLLALTPLAVGGTYGALCAVGRGRLSRLGATCLVSCGLAAPLALGAGTGHLPLLLHPAPAELVVPAGPGETLIVVAQFDAGPARDPQAETVAMLDACLSEYPDLQGAVRVARFPEAMSGADPEQQIVAAQRVADALGATILVWGQAGVEHVRYLFYAPPCSCGCTPDETPAVSGAWDVVTPGDQTDSAEYLEPLLCGQLHLARRAFATAQAQFAEALAALDRSDIREWPRRPIEAILLSHSAIAHTGLGEYERATRAFDRAIIFTPDFCALYGLRGIAYALQEEWDLAIAEFDRAIDVEPADAFAYDARGYTHWLQGDVEEALADYDRAIELAPAYSDARIHRAIALSARHHWSAAIADLDRVIKMEPDCPDAYYLRALISAEHNYLKPAIRDLDRVVEMEPWSADAYSARGAVYAADGNLERAVADLHLAIALRPDGYDDYYLLACCEALLGHTPEALDSLEAALLGLPTLSRAKVLADGAFEGIRGTREFRALLDDYRPE